MIFSVRGFYYFLENKSRTPKHLQIWHFFEVIIVLISKYMKYLILAALAAVAGSLKIEK
jgi:hypothetical protein